MKIDNFRLGSRTLIIAELSANHGHDIQIAKKTIKAAKESGADAIKLQTYTADTMTIDCNNEYFKFDATHNFGWKDTWEGSQEEWQKENDRDFFYPWQIIPIYLDEKDKKIDINSKIESYLSTSIWKVATIIEILKKNQIYKAIKELLEKC